MRVGSTGPVINLTGQSRKVTDKKNLDMYLGRLVSPWSLLLFPGCRALCFVCRHCLQHCLWCAREKREETATKAWAISDTRSARSPGRPDERPDERTSYLLCMQSPAPARSLAEPPPAASPQLGRWICQQGLRSARMRCSMLLVLAAARVLLLLCFCCCCFVDDSYAFFTFGVTAVLRVGMHG